MMMYFKEPKETFEISSSPAIGLALAVAVVGVLAIGIIPSFFVNIARIATAGF